MMPSYPIDVVCLRFREYLMLQYLYRCSVYHRIWWIVLPVFGNCIPKVEIEGRKGSADMDELCTQITVDLLNHGLVAIHYECSG
jgi:hypothetical protein